MVAVVSGGTKITKYKYNKGCKGEKNLEKNRRMIMRRIRSSGKKRTDRETLANLAVNDGRRG